MKATGIVRRIDDLGRVVIPKEIRRTLRIREGDPLEIYTATDGEVIFKKYSPVGELSAFASQYAEVLSRVSGLPVIICDKDHVIAASGVSKRELLERRVSPVLENYMESRKSYTATQATVGDIQPVEGVEHRAAVIYPIIAAGDVTGAVVMLMGEDNKVPTETEVKLAHSAAAFLMTIEPLSSLWNFTSDEHVIPAEDDITAAAERVNWKNVKLDGNTLTFLSPDTTIDLGSIAKGYIADRMKDYLTESGVESAIINLGGNVLCVGERTNHQPFRIGLQKPFADYATVFADLNIDDMSVVSSGVYERHFEENGVNYHHLLNPKTGYPYQNGLVAVTIVSPRSVDGDVLSTTCFSMGLDKGLELINSMDGIYAYFITDDYELIYSDGAEAFIDEIKEK